MSFKPSSVLSIEDVEQLRMYIVVRKDIDIGHAMLAVGHGVLAAYNDVVGDVSHPYRPLMIGWCHRSFRKCVVEATDEQFELVKAELPEDSRRVMVESGLDGAETAVVAFPRRNEIWPKSIKYLPLYGKGKVLVDA